MPQKRRQNAARGKKQGTSRGSSATGTVGRASAQNDIIGVILACLAIAMLVSLVAPSSALVTHAVSEVLFVCFGVGAILCPISLLLFAVTFFIEGEEPLGTRAAMGLGLISLAILSLISLFVPGADADPAIVLDPAVLRDAGGYVGGGVSWVLLSLLGKPVGIVLLVGLAILGIIVCGFSISGCIIRLREGAIHIGQLRAEAREERMAYARTQRTLAEESAPEQPRTTMMDSGAKTTYIGARQTSVLTRRPRRQANRTKVRNDELALDADVEESVAILGEDETARTVALDRGAEPQPDEKGSARKTRRRPAKKEGGKSRQPKEPSVSEPSIPDFLKNPKASSKPKAKAGTGPKSATRPGDGAEGYELPPLSILSSNPDSAGSASSQEELDETMSRLQGTLQEFGLTSRVVDYISGPIVTTFRVEMGEGERVNRIKNLEDDIALTLAAEKVRIFAPIPGTSYVGIEIPNSTRQSVCLGDVLPFASGGPLEVAIGRDSSGKPVVADIAKMPHMLVAGTTGSGKSVMINSMIMSLLMRTTPKQVRLIMIDPKRVEFSCYNGLPHLYVPVVTEPRQAASALQWAVSEMERRLKVFERAGAREIKVYNRMCVSGKLAEMENPPEPMPYLVVVIDELSDLMMVAGKDVEASIVRIAQLARAAGIHLLIATQRPSANVVTGLIKSNIDNRVALKVSSGIDSRVILDEVGAERLLGNGDMLFKYRGLNMQRVLGCYTSDNEINGVVDFIREQAEPDYHEEILTAVVPGQAPGGAPGGGVPEDDDPLVWEAAQIVVESRLGSTSGLQRRLKVGYARAGRIMDMLESKGVVGPPDGSKPREVLLDEDGLEELRVQDAKYREVV
ncbi:MAG: DNA translocase FtsK [Coriobacteriales bacterium]|nr:DNA translocase FtsK [Coriobacteriales bacterium]